MNLHDTCNWLRYAAQHRVATRSRRARPRLGSHAGTTGPLGSNGSVHLARGTRGRAGGSVVDVVAPKNEWLSD